MICCQNFNQQIIKGKRNEIILLFFTHSTDTKKSV